MPNEARQPGHKRANYLSVIWRFKTQEGEPVSSMSKTRNSLARMYSESSAIISGVGNQHWGLGNSSSWLHFLWPAPLNTHCRSLPHSFPDEGLRQEKTFAGIQEPLLSERLIPPHSLLSQGWTAVAHPSLTAEGGDKALQLLNKGLDNSHSMAF